MFGFNQIIKSVSRVSDFIFHSASQHHSHDPLPFRSDPRQVWCDPRGHQVNTACLVFCAGSLCNAPLTVPMFLNLNSRLLA